MSAVDQIPAMVADQQLLKLRAAGVDLMAARQEFSDAVQTQTAAHAAYKATMPLVGRVRLGHGDEKARSVHYVACERVARTRRRLNLVEADFVSASLAYLDAVEALDTTDPAPDAAHGVSDSDPGKR